MWWKITLSCLYIPTITRNSLLPLFVFTQQICHRDAGVRHLSVRPSVNSRLSGTRSRSRPISIGSNLSTKSPDHFFFRVSNFKSLFFSFQFSLKWDPMGAKISKRYSSHKSHPCFFVNYISWIIWLQYQRKVTSFRVFEILTFWILMIFFSFSLTCNYNAGLIFKTLLLLQIVTKSFKLLLNLCLYNLHNVTFSDVLNTILNVKFEILTWESIWKS